MTTPARVRLDLSREDAEHVFNLVAWQMIQTNDVHYMVSPQITALYQQIRAALSPSDETGES